MSYGIRDIGGRVGISDGANLAAFSRLRTAHPEAVFDSQHEYGQGTLYWWTSTSGALSTSAQLPNENVVLMTCGTEVDAYCIRQTKEYHRYQPGKSQMIIMTFVMGAAVNGVVRRVGYFDGNNGLFLEQTGSDVAVVRRTFTSGSPVDNRVVQSAWNIDKLDGTGPSRLTLDLSKSQIFVVDFQWLGMGRVRFGFDIGGEIFYVHEMVHANVLTLPYMQTPNLPVRYEIRNTSLQGGTNTMKECCCTVVSEGGRERDFSFHFSANTGTSLTAVTTRRAILSIRPTLLHNGKTNRVKIVVDQFSSLTKTNDVLYELVYNPTFTGTPTWTQQDPNGFSAIEYSRHGDAAAGALTGGIIVDTTFGVSNSGSFSATEAHLTAQRLPIVLDMNGANPIAYSLVCTSLSGTANVGGELGWYEIR